MEDNKTIELPPYTDNDVKAHQSDNGVKLAEIWAIAFVLIAAIVFGAWVAMVGIQRDEHVRTSEIQVLKK